MYIPKDVFEKGIVPGEIYLLKKHNLTHTTEPHYFIVVGRNEDEVVLFSCCTSQFEKRKRFIELKNLPLTTLVHIKPDSVNNFKVDTYVDCNKLHSYTINELHGHFIMDRFKSTGRITEGKFEELRTGINDSPAVVGEYKDIVNGNGQE